MSLRPRSQRLTIQPQGLMKPHDLSKTYRLSTLFYFPRDPHQVDIDLVEFFRTIMFKTTTTGSTSRAVKNTYGRSSVQSTRDWRSVSTIREFAMIRPPSPVHNKEGAGENKALSRYVCYDVRM